jgi:hypothetical protein
VRQEAYAYLCVHYAIRWLMHAVATEAGHDPDRLSFTRTLRAARRTTASHAGFFPLRPSTRRMTRPARNCYTNSSARAARALTRASSSAR